MNIQKALVRANRLKGGAMNKDVRRVLKDIERIIEQDPHRGGYVGDRVLLYISFELCRDLLEGLKGK